MARQLSEIEIRIEVLGGIVVAEAFDRSHVVGKASLSVEGTTACLLDILVRDNVPVGTSWIRTALARPKRRNYRGIGIGTKLLSDVEEQLKRNGISRLEGKMKGDIVRLTRWYRSCGFLVDEVKGTIAKTIK